MNYLTAVLMGALQGVTEFLPISSSGHLALFQHFFGMEDIETSQMFFSVMLHFGTLISICIYYFHDVLDMIREFFLGLASLKRRGGRAAIPPARRLVLLIVVATLPLFAVLPVMDLIEQATGSVTFISIALLCTGFLLFLSDRMARGRKTERTASLTDALAVGLAQAVGTLPGISRSGMTISAGLLRGYDRPFAVRFSFLMSLPAVLGATLLELKDAIELGIDPAIIPYCVVGVAVAAVVGYLSIGLVNTLADRGKFGAFAWYCWAVGGVSLAASFLVK